MRDTTRTDGRGTLGGPAGWAVALLLAVAAELPGQVSLEPRVPAGTALPGTGLLLQRELGERGWEAVGEKAAVHTRDDLLALPGMRAGLTPAAGSTELTLWGSLPELSGFPGLQSTVRLHDTRAYDLDVSLLSGRVVITSRKSEGAARVWVRLPTLVENRPGAPTVFGLQLTLGQAGDAVALEVYGRWPRGVPFRKTPLPLEVPTRALHVLVLRGQVDLKADGYTYTLAPPPGPASFSWDSVVGPAGGPQRVEALPRWASGKDLAAEARTAEPAGPVKQLVKEVEARGPSGGLVALLRTADAEKDPERAARLRELSIFGLAALDQLGLVASALEDRRHGAVRQAAVLALRHHIGERPGRDLTLFEVLQGSLGYTEAEAGTVLQMLHSPFVPGEVETYETLLAYLRHQRLAIRTLALWHLIRLLPEGEKIGFDPAAEEGARGRSLEAWQMLVRKQRRG